jgi:Ca2+-binding EF-hand superfamily protein
MKIYRPLTILFALSVSAAMAQTAPADPTSTPAAKMQARLKAADTNGDGRISRDEAAALPHLAKHFDKLDQNKDGYLTPDEIKAARSKIKGAQIARADANGDGRISRDEAAKYPKLAKHFDQIDTNKDGYLSREEIKAARQQRVASN